jgi:hypothetical protein
LIQEEKNVRHIISEFEAMQKANTKTKIVTKMVTKYETKMVLQKVTKTKEQNRPVVVLAHKLEFKGVMAKDLNTPAIKANIEKELSTQLSVKEPSKLTITSIEDDAGGEAAASAATHSLMEMATAAVNGLFRGRRTTNSEATIVTATDNKVQIMYEVVTPEGQDNQVLEQQMNALDQQQYIVNVVAKEADVEIASIQMEPPKSVVARKRYDL